MGGGRPRTIINRSGILNGITGMAITLMPEKQALLVGLVIQLPKKASVFICVHMKTIVLPGTLEVNEDPMVVASMSALEALCQKTGCHQ